MDFDKKLAAPLNVYMVGIKGTGMCALAELLLGRGVSLSGSDRGEVFYTDQILKNLGVPYYESFAASHVPADAELIIYSAAYTPDTNPELEEAVRRGIPLLKYPDALGLYSAGFDASGIAGVHGKTTTTGLAGALVRGTGLPAQVLAGSAVSGFGGRSTLNRGDAYFIAETCEYRRHFLSFHPRRIVLTSVESDHQDYYPSYGSIRDAFLEYIRKLPPQGELIYCADDPGARETAEMARGEGRELRLTPYGFSAPGPFGIRAYRPGEGGAALGIQGFPGDLTLRIPGKHNALNAAAALALVSSLVQREFPGEGEAGDGWTEDRREGVRRELEGFRGGKRRSELLGEAGGILFMDDYAHHPTAIKTTLEGIRAFYPGRRIIVSFMSHTYTRTAALLDEFAASFAGADVVALHKIYGSAREEYRGGVTGETLYEKTRALRPEVYYRAEPGDAAELLKGILRRGDIFLTMGAGDNWKLGAALLAWYQSAQPETARTEGGSRKA